MNGICTISTPSHLFKVYALADSLRLYDQRLYVLYLGDFNDGKNIHPDHLTSIHWVNVNDLDTNEVNSLQVKYGGDSDEFRWALKPLLLNYLCQTMDKVVYVDNDICFFQSPEVIFEKLSGNKILLTPHFYPKSPTIKGANWFEANFQVGIYNAGFIGVRKDAIDFLTWWSEACLYEMRKSYFRGLFDDQKYLDIVPALFQPVYIHPHPSWNFAAWNTWFPGINLKQDKLFVGEEALVFIHFTNLSLTDFSDPSHIAHGYYLQYLDLLTTYDSNPQPLESKFSKRHVRNYIRYLYWRFLTRHQK